MKLGYPPECFSFGTNRGGNYCHLLRRRWKTFLNVKIWHFYASILKLSQIIIWWYFSTWWKTLLAHLNQMQYIIVICNLYYLRSHKLLQNLMKSLQHSMQSHTRGFYSIWKWAMGLYPVRVVHFNLCWKALECLAFPGQRLLHIIERTIEKCQSITDLPH